MAGRPQKMAKRVTELEVQAREHWEQVLDTCPSQYVGLQSNDPVCNAWNAAVGVTYDAMLELENLRGLLLEKAGLATPASPTSAVGDGPTGPEVAADESPTSVTPAAG